MKKVAVIGLLIVAISQCDRSHANGVVSVSTAADIVDGDTSSISALLAHPGADGLISLREALTAANNTPSDTNSPNTVTVPAGVYQVSKGELTIGSQVNLYTAITGQGPSAGAVIQQSTVAAVINLNPKLTANVRVSIENVTITGGSGIVTGGGGIVGGGTGNSLTLTNCVIAGNRTLSQRIGGGISWSGGGDLTINSCIFSNNIAANAVGGAICFDNGNGNPGNLSIANSVFYNNQATGGAGAGQGAALYVALDSGSSAYINQCSFSNNICGSPLSQGGGVYASSGSIVIRNGQFSLNSANEGTDTFNNGGALLTFLNEFPPQITVQPLSQTAFIGTPVTFSVTALSSNTISYQWLRNQVPLTDSGHVAGSATNRLIVQLVTPSDQAAYSVIVSNVNGAVTSSNAQLSVALVYPKFSSPPIAIDGKQAYFSGISGAPNGQYTVLTATNIDAPALGWTPISTNYFDDTGAFFFNDALTPSHRFYKLQIP